MALKHFLATIPPTKTLVDRGDTATCLIKSVIQGPKGATFPSGTASISYFLGRYATLVLNKGDKGGVDGMDSFVRDNYFPVVEKVEGNSKRWVADYNFEVKRVVVGGTDSLSELNLSLVERVPTSGDVFQHEQQQMLCRILGIDRARTLNRDFT